MSVLRDRLGVSARSITSRSTASRARTSPAAQRRSYARHAAALFAALPPNDQQHLASILARLAETLAATSAAEGRPLDLDSSGFRLDIRPTPMQDTAVTSSGGPKDGPKSTRKP